MNVSYLIDDIMSSVICIINKIQSEILPSFEKNFFKKIFQEVLTYSGKRDHLKTLHLNDRMNWHRKRGWPNRYASWIGNNKKWVGSSDRRRRSAVSAVFSRSLAASSSDAFDHRLERRFGTRPDWPTPTSQSGCSSPPIKEAWRWKILIIR